MFRNIAIVLSMEDAQYVAALQRDQVLLDQFAAKTTETAAVINRTAQQNVDARMKEQGALVVLRDEYVALADAAVKGSAEQVTAAKLAAEANTKLAASGLEVKASQGAVNEAMGLFSQLGVKVGGSGATASKALQGITSDAGAMSLGVTAAVAAGVIGFALLAASGISSYVKLGNQTRILQGVTGSTAEQASELIFVFNQIGTNADTLTLSFARFGKNINDMPSKFAALGVEIARTNTGAADVFGTFENLKKTFDSTTDAATRDAIVMDLLGRGASSLIPYLNLTTAELAKMRTEAQALGLSLSGSDVEATRQFGIATKELHSTLSAFGIMVGREVLPVLTGLAQLGTDVFTGIGLGVQKVDQATKSTGFWGQVLKDVGHDLAQIGLAGVGGTSAFNDQIGKTKKATDDTEASVQSLIKGYSSMGVSLSELDAKQIIANKSQQQLFNAYQAFDTKMINTAASVGLSVDGMKTDIGVFGAVAPEDFQKVTDAATKMASAINAGVNAASGALSKDLSATSYFSASSIQSRDSAAASAAKSANGIVTADTRVADAEQHVADLTQQYADQSASAKQAWADKVASNDQQVADAEQSLADTIDTNNQRVRDSDQKLADDRISLAQSVSDAQQRLEDDRRSGQQSVQDAEQRLNDTRRRQGLESNPQALKALNDQIAIRDAKAAVATAQQNAQVKEKSDLDAIGKAKQNQIKTLADDQAAADKARVTAAKEVEKAEDAVAKAKDTQNKLAVEGLTVGEETRAQQVEMRKAIEAVGTAQRTVAADAVKSTGTVSDAIALTVDDVKGFYSSALTQANEFEAGIHKAIADGYDPGFIAGLLQEGPKEAAPIIEAILSDHSGTMVGIVNQGQQQINKVTDLAVTAAHAVYVATTTSNAQVRRELQSAYAIMEAEADAGGTLTADALADKLGYRKADVLQIAADYGLQIADGLNPVLQGIGASKIPYYQNNPGAAQRQAEGFAGPAFAGGGQVPGGYGSRDEVPAMLTKGEIVFSVPAVQAAGADNLLALHAALAKGYAAGGFVTAADVPLPPDVSMYGSMLGYTTDKADRYAYDAVVKYLSSGTGGSGGGLSGSGSGGPPPARPTGQVSDWVAAGVDLAGKPGWWVTPEVNIAMFESGGDPNAINNWDSNAAAGTPSKGLMQVIDPTFRANMVEGHGDIWNPVDNVAAASNYIASRYGDPSRTPGELSVARGGSYEGYALGGLVGAMGGLHYGSMDSGGWLEPGWNLNHNGLGVREPVGVTAAASMIDYDKLAAAVRAVAPDWDYGRIGQEVAGAIAAADLRVMADKQQIGVVVAQAFTAMRKGRS